MSNLYDDLRRFVDHCEQSGMTGEEFIEEFCRQVYARADEILLELEYECDTLIGRVLQ